ncbi:MAG: hypothetical protein ACRDKB_05655 [Actinomycetota bacterium]
MATVLLVGGDLSAKARLEAAAAVAKVELRLTGFGRMREALTASRPAVLVLDLDDGRERVLEELSAARSEGLAPEVVFGYYSHVDEGLAEAARRAGCEPIPRGRFWRSLPDLLTRRASEP